MFHAQSIPALRERLAAYRQRGETIAFVPTMGNLHAGHLYLVQQAKQLASLVVTSIFVNPMQFSAGEDFDRYPRTLEEDASALEKAGNHVLFTPAVEEVYPLALADMTRIHVPALGDVLCGQHRPGHFDGVCTVVAKLMNMVQPHIACFGEKDYQQLLIIKRMLRDLNMPVQIQACETQRESDGLAMSSRNHYLSSHERGIAPLLYQTLQQLRQQARAGEAEDNVLLAEATRELEQAGFQVQYLEIRHADNLLPATSRQQSRRLFVAAYLGSTRLIDNIPL